LITGMLWNGRVESNNGHNAEQLLFKIHDRYGHGGYGRHERLPGKGNFVHAYGCQLLLQLISFVANTIIGPHDDIPFFPISEQLDYEAEFAFVIGKRARNVGQQDALHYVAGYTIANDVTYRDIQRRTIQWLQGKTVEGSAPMGPWLVTGDELKDPYGLEVVLRVNGEERQHSNTANLVFTVPYLVEFLSNLMTLEPGDIILTGTPGGVGVAREPQVFLNDGDVVRIEIDGIGALENKVKSTK
jgi:acylpyruvate hydrolase